MQLILWVLEELGNTQTVKKLYVDYEKNVHFRINKSREAYHTHNRLYVFHVTNFCFFYISYNIIILFTLCPGVYSAANRNEYQKHKNNNVSGE
jgi:hypothetical protein